MDLANKKVVYLAILPFNLNVQRLGTTLLVNIFIDPCSNVLKVCNCTLHNLKSYINSFPFSSIDVLQLLLTYAMVVESLINKAYC